MMNKRIVFLISGIDKALAFEWIADFLSKQYKLAFIFMNAKEGETEKCIRNKGIECHSILYRGKKDLFPAFLKTVSLLKKINPAVVHTHLFEASLLGLSAAKLLRIPRRIYTRHHGTIHHLYFVRAVYYDKLINSLATHIVAISKGVEEILTKMEGVSSQKVTVIPHGFALNTFFNVEHQRILHVKKRHAIPEDATFIIGLIARYTEWKGIQYSIAAFSEILKQYPKAHLILANAQGDYAAELKKMLIKLPEDSYTEINFESDIAALYHCFDLFVHVPVNPLCEAFGQTYVEALAAGIPSIFTLSGIAREFIRDKHNAIVVPFRDAKSIEDAVILLQSQPLLRVKLSENGKKEVAEQFALQKMLQQLVELYEE